MENYFIVVMVIIKFCQHDVWGFLGQSEGMWPYYFKFGGVFDTCWQEIAVSVMTQYNLICLKLMPTQLTVATLNITFIFCYTDFKQKTNDAQNSQFLSNETGKAIYSIGLWWILLLDSFHAILIFPLKHCMGVQ